MRCPEVATTFSYWSDSRTAYRLFGAPECVELSASRDGLHWRSEAHFSLEETARPAIACVGDGGAVLISPVGNGVPAMERLAGGQCERILEARPEWYETHPGRGSVWADPCVRRAGRASVALWARRFFRGENLGRFQDGASIPSRAFWAARTPVARGQAARGCIGTGVSLDTVSWAVEPPLYAPGAYEAIRWPHVFALPRRATALFSTPREDGGYAIRYAGAEAMEGPFFKPGNDLVCTDARVIVQTIPLGLRRLAYFLCATEEGLRPSRASEVATDEDGRPRFQFLPDLTGLCRKTLLHTQMTLEEPELLVRLLPTFSRNVAFEALIETEGQPAGLVVRASASGRDNTVVWLDYEAQRVKVRSGVRGRLLESSHHPLCPSVETRLMLWVEDDLLSVYVDNDLVLVASVAARQQGALGVVAEKGRARFGNVLAWELAPTPI